MHPLRSLLLHTVLGHRRWDGNIRWIYKSAWNDVPGPSLARGQQHRVQSDTMYSIPVPPSGLLRTVTS